ncbi:MAG: peptide chain release factor 2 [Thermoguttaceae bacterium]|nr:peptide chain release factor 2 [Thermoguttaceae bacterium]
MPIEKELTDRIDAIRTGIAKLHDSLDYDEKLKLIAETEKEMAAPGFWDDAEKSQATVARLKGYKAVVKPIDDITAALDELDVLVELGSEDDSLAAEIPPKLAGAEKQMERLETSALLNGPFDVGNAIVSINARDGGTDANDWAEMLLRMYINWSQSAGYTVEILDRQDNEEAGINSASFIIKGPMAYGYMKGEIGTHRLVRISPFNSEAKRMTSFAAVDVNPDIDDSIHVELRDEDIREDVFRSSGAGGQHVNKTSSAIRLTHIPTGTVVQCQNERSQHKNRAMALKMLKARLIQREEEKREQAMSEKYKNMAKVGFGSQIRNYFLHPEQRVKDSRTGYQSSNFHDVLNGNIQPFMDEYLRWRVKTD